MKLFSASQRGYLDIVEALLAVRADTKTIDYKGRTALYFAQNSGSESVREYNQVIAQLLQSAV